MARFGEGINPALGRTDYSQFLAGAMQGAQSRAQGAAAIGQGIGSALQSIGQGIQQYQQNKAIAGTQIAKFEGAVRADPTLIQGAPEGIGKLIQKLQKDGSLKLTDAAQLGAYVDTYQQQRQLAMQQQAAMAQQQRAEADRKAIGIGLSAMQGGKMDPLAAIQSMGMQVSPDVAQYFTNMQRARADIGKTQAETAALGRPKVPDQSFEEAAFTDAVNNFVAQNRRQPTPAESLNIRKDVARMRQNQTSVNVQPGENAYSKTLGEESAKADLADFNSAQTAERNISKLQKTIQLLAEGKAETGPLATVITDLNRLRSKFLKDVEAGRSVEDTQILNALLGSRVFEQIQALGIGARGLDTPAEREYLREVMTGTIEMDANALRRLAELSIEKEASTIGRYNERVARGELDRFFEGSGRKKQTFTLPEMPQIKATAPVSLPKGWRIVK